MNGLGFQLLRRGAPDAAVVKPVSPRRWETRERGQRSLFQATGQRLNVGKRRKDNQEAVKLRTTPHQRGQCCDKHRGGGSDGGR